MSNTVTVIRSRSSLPSASRWVHPGWVCVAALLSFICCPIMWFYVLSSVLWCPLRCSVRLYLQLFVEGCMSYLHYLCLFAHSGVQYILCCVFVLFFFVLCTLCCQYICIVVFWLPLRYSLTLISCCFIVRRLSCLWPIAW